ncbi:hypothetical protein [Geothermobacter hydrogeniphilus]|uniref:Uncharacterized protein n=1 Tax=Geothermobacter hydrogeniphilus TaxID=1969733 RepID=A0A1X0XX66_9BACT|nr:hypothetical protein [Geothermobacter hydrogeniphilus]ORJ57484.1 hypothetical protein B5V00_13625 [Geothermobacter hydrogeniphilus]
MFDFLEKAVDAISDYGDIFNSLQKSFLNDDFLENIKSGRLLIPHEGLYLSMKMAIEKEEGVYLEKANFYSSHIRLVLSVIKLGAKIDLPLKLTITSFEINKRNQNIIFEYESDEPIGKNLIGRIIISISRGLIDSILKDKISNISNISTTYSDDNNIIYVDLRNIEQIKYLSKPIPGINYCILDFLKLTGIEHTCEGVFLLGEVSSITDLSLERLGSGDIVS